MSFQNQSRKMAQEQAEPQQQLTSEQLLPTSEHLRFGDSNHLFNPHQFKCDHPIIVEILKNHPIFPTLNNTAIEIPQIYIQKFWNTIHVVEESKYVMLEVTVNRYTTKLTSDSLRSALDLPTTTSNKRHGFEVLPGNNRIQQLFLELGFNNDLIKLINTSSFNRKCLPGLWATMFSILN